MRKKNWYLVQITRQKRTKVLSKYLFKCKQYNQMRFRFCLFCFVLQQLFQAVSQGQLLEMQLLESWLLDTFFENVNCSTEKSRLLESGKTWFGQLIKKVKLLEISSRWQNFCNSKIKIFNIFHIGKKEKSGTCTA